MTNLDSILKSRDMTWPTKVHLVKGMVFLSMAFSRQEILDWIAISSPGWFLELKPELLLHLLHCRKILCWWATGEAPFISLFLTKSNSKGQQSIWVWRQLGGLARLFLLLPEQVLSFCLWGGESTLLTFLHLRIYDPFHLGVQGDVFTVMPVVLWTVNVVHIQSIILGCLVFLGFFPKIVPETAVVYMREHHNGHQKISV